MPENETAKQDEVTVGEYKGNPVITLPIGPRGGFTFGLTKARAIIKYLDDIKSFIEKNEPKQE
ncbi:MAG: hypothetical protein JW832_11105 [Deltaproteobacteria bacterium]|nr:hypothetical protein [Deltaproteobacteria bacterium]